MQALAYQTISAPGFLGVNTTDSPTDLESGYALSAINCVIDKYGRIGSRNGHISLHTTLAALGTAPVQAIGEHIDTDGVSTICVAGNNKLFKLVAGVLTELTYGGGGVAPVITSNNWQIVSIAGFLTFWQIGYDPLAYVPSVSTTQYRRISEIAGYLGTVNQSNAAIAAYGRIWNASTTANKVLIQFSDVGAPQKYTGGTSGTLDLTNVWPIGGDAIVGLGAHNNKLFIFGKKTILVYRDANTPASMVLDDAIVGIGAFSRDTITPTGTDIVFLSPTGVRSLTRTIQEKSAPMRDISANVRDDLLTALEGETETTVKATWNQRDGFYLLTLENSQIDYCFDTKKTLQDGSARVTTWDSITPRALFTTVNGDMLIGKPGFVGQYSGYLDNDVVYRMQYYSPYVDFGSPESIAMLKKIITTVIGGSDQNVVTKWSYDYSQSYVSQQIALTASSLTAQYNISEFNIGEYSNGLNISTLSVQGSGSGRVAQVGIETDINGQQLSIQKMQVYVKNGRIG